MVKNPPAMVPEFSHDQKTNFGPNKLMFKLLVPINHFEMSLVYVLFYFWFLL